ncbi:unnamed protein product [Rotaria sp. Silwood1]|nr:unnamed protein product [Rotaria sp. Silwood1]CAF4560636.1 unnamed protein product [Rotaria sp. Silwood1]
MMYNIPDTTVINVGGAEVLISVYSPNKTVKSKFVAENTKALLEASAQYLGGTLPVTKYAFLYYFFTGIAGSGAAGALEHNNSSMYSLGEGPPSSIAGQNLMSTAKEGDNIEIEVARKDADGNEKLVTLKGKIIKVDGESKAEVKVGKNPTDEQLRLRKAWMGS